MLKRKLFSSTSLLLVVLLLKVLVAPAQMTGTSAGKLTAQEQLARDLLQELIETDTTHSTGNPTKAAEAMRARLRAAGFPEADIQVIGPRPDRSNLVARLRGTGSQKPILLLAHLDVVEARREDWSVDPFKFLERDGYFYGRGTSDIKNGAASLVANLIRLKREGFKPDRDVILALTADEEEGDANGVEWLLKNHRELIDAAYCINTDAGDGQIKNGKRMRVTVQTSEKVYQDFQLEVKNRGGHSSLPVKDNAIYHLVDGLARLAKFEFPVRLNETTRLYFERVAESETGQVAADMKAFARNPTDANTASRLSASPFYNAVMRTTCVATMLAAGHAPNALPQTATANVNCRLLPEDSPADVQRTLVEVLADDQITVTPRNEPKPSPPSPLVPTVLQPIEKVSAGMWPGIAVVPIMETGASDGLFLRRAGVPVYGISGMFFDIDDVRAHGKDERIGVQSYYEGVEFMYRLLKALTSGK
jgi:acetylornithine deacetylase/succinyl-diaminopimelate desuccinylase-like protein